MSELPISSWSERLGARVRVIAETATTMDAARRLQLRPGEAVVAGRQTAGRGRLGRVWDDTGFDGIAFTFAVTPGPPERLSIAVAIGVARAAEQILKRAVTIKWPNDVHVDGRKLSGILVERVDGVDMVGVGINVNQTRWPADIATRAVSLRELCGRPLERVDVAVTALGCIDEALKLDDDDLRAAFRERDMLVGTAARFRSGQVEIDGVVTELDPLRGLGVTPTGGGEAVWLPAATTTVL
jgi:BirA family biotin operon repressor/biotin-[acetyl-CoA-carboxylase] ligase